jgi:hypothetical protein
VDLIDLRLQPERVNRRGRKVTYRSQLDRLPDGVMVVLDRDPDVAYLSQGNALYPWSLEGYGPPLQRASEEVAVLTPASIVRAIAAGYAPGIHVSLLRQSARREMARGLEGLNHG